MAIIRGMFSMRIGGACASDYCLFEKRLNIVSNYGTSLSQFREANAYVIGAVY